MKCFQARPDRGAMRAYVSLGMAMDKSVFTRPLPRAGMTAMRGKIRRSRAGSIEVVSATVQSFRESGDVDVPRASRSRAFDAFSVRGV